MSAANGVRVLVVDDEPTLAELVTMALRYEGWEVRSAGNGMTAVRLARDFRPDVVVLDVMLPDLSGLDVLRRLREHTPNLPVLFLTAKDAVEDRIAGLTAGPRRGRTGGTQLGHSGTTPDSWTIGPCQQ